MGRGENVEVERFEWLLSAQVTMGAGVPGPDVPYLEPSLSPGVQTCHRALAGTGASQFGPIHITLAGRDGIQILALRLGLLKVSFKGINWMNKSI